MKRLVSFSSPHKHLSTTCRFWTCIPGKKIRTQCKLNKYSNKVVNDWITVQILPFIARRLHGRVINLVLKRTCMNEWILCSLSRRCMFESEYEYYMILFKNQYTTSSIIIQPDPNCVQGKIKIVRVHHETAVLQHACIQHTVWCIASYLENNVRAQLCFVTS